MKKVGITGGIGAGKSTVSAVFKLLGIPVYDADSRAKWLMENDADVKTAILQMFGTDAYVEGRLDNKYLASLVFTNPSLVKELNSLVHPAVAKDFVYWTSMQGKVPFVLKEAALLYESGSYQDLDAMIVVTSPLELRIDRVLRRDPHRDRKQVLSIIERQLPEEEKAGKADFVVINDEKQFLIEQVLHIYKELQ